MRLYLCAAALLVATVGGVASATTISFADFSSTAGLTLNGASGAINTGGQGVLYNGNRVLRMTNDFNQSSSAFTTSPVSLASNASFSTFFTFQITGSRGIGDADGPGADGLCFVVQTVSNTSGGAGGGIGYAGLPNSVAIEYDTYNNGGGDANNGNHVGVDIAGNVNSAALQTIGTRMNDGNLWYSWVDYNGVTNDLDVRLSQINARPALATLSYNVDLVTVLGTTNAFVGFTAGTGSGAGEHDILNWEFENRFAPIGNAPLPTAAGMGMLGMGLLAARRRR